MLIENAPRRAAIVGYHRIPFARNNTAYTEAGNQDMMVAALNGLIERYHLQGLLMGEVAGGAVIKHSWEINLMRECVMSTSLDPATAACDIQQACNTGVESAIYIANKIALGQIEAGIAGGVDSASNVPLVLGEKLRTILLRARRARSFSEQLKQFSRIRIKDLSPVAPLNRGPDFPWAAIPRSPQNIMISPAKSRMCMRWRVIVKWLRLMTEVFLMTCSRLTWAWTMITISGEIPLWKNSQG